jgi:hypothetical protein
MEAVLSRQLPRDVVRVVLLQYLRRDYYMCKVAGRVRRARRLPRAQRNLSFKPPHVFVFPPWVHVVTPFITVDSLRDFLRTSPHSTHAALMHESLGMQLTRTSLTSPACWIGSYYRIVRAMDTNFTVVKFGYRITGAANFFGLEWIIYYGDRCVSNWPSSWLADFRD